MVERRVLAFPNPATTPFPAGSVILLDHPTENSFAVDIQTVVAGAITRLATLADIPVGSDYIPVVRGDVTWLLPARNFKDLIPTATTLSAGLMSASDKLKLNGVNLSLLVKTGGTIGQVPVKLGSADGDWAWADAPGGGGGGEGSLDSLASTGTGTSLISEQGAGIATLRALAATGPVTLTVDGTGAILIAVTAATTSASGLLSASDKLKLDSVAENAEPNPETYAGVTVGLVPGPINLPASAARFLAEDGVWRVPSGSGGGGSFGDAPADGTTYGRNNNEWVAVDSASLAGLADVDVGSAVDDMILRYGGGIWFASAETVPAVADLSDAQISSPSNNDVFKYNSTLGKWVNGSPGSSTGGPIALATTLTGPATHSFVAGDVDKITRCNIAAGDVVIEVGDDVATSAGEVLAAAFLTEGATGTYRLIFQNSGTAQTPAILGTGAAPRSSGVANTAVTANSNDTRTITVQAGTDRVVTFIVFASRAVIATPTDIRLSFTPSGGSTTVIGAGGGEPDWQVKSMTSDASHDIYMYTHPMGTDVDDDITVSTTVVMNGGNVNSYVLMNVKAQFVDQTTPTENATAGHDIDPPTSQFNQIIAGTTGGPNRRMIYAAAQPTQTTGYPSPSIAGATQLQTGSFTTTSLNRAGGTFILGEEAAGSAGAYDALVTYPVVYDRARLAFAYVPSVVATMELRTVGDVAASTNVNNKQVTMLYSSDTGIANILL